MEITGALHLHSTHSYDGKLSLAELKTLLQTQGVNFACMSEHTDELSAEQAAAFVAECRALSDEQFIFVPGFEVPYKNTHVLMLGCAEFVCAFAEADELRSWSFNSAMTVLAHPVRNDFVVDEDLLSVLDGVEIWNQQYEGKWLPRYRSAALLEKLRLKKSGLLATGGIDLHRAEHFGSPLLYMEVEEFSVETILAALQNGRYAFGTNELQIDADATWQPTILESIQSRLQILIIDSGKGVNKFLAALGLSLPKSWKRFIRRLV